MDPNETLKALREISQLIQVHLADGGDEEDLEGYAEHISELFDAMDDWLTCGSFKPHSWEGDTDRALTKALVEVDTLKTKCQHLREERNELEEQLEAWEDDLR